MRLTPTTLLLALAGAAAASPAFAAPRGLDVRDLATLDRVSSPTLSPEGRFVVFAKRSVDLAANKSSTALYIEDLRAKDAAPPRRLTPAGWNVNTPAFSPDGRTVYFLSARGGSQQLHAIDANGGAPRAVTALPVDVTGYSLAPDGKRVALGVESFADCKDLACTKSRMDARGKRQGSGEVFDRLFVRHWDTWRDGRLNRLVVAPVGTKPVATATPIALDVVGDVPSKPFGDFSEVAWAPDGRTLVVSARKAGASEPWSTNFDLYRVNADGTGAATNLTAGNKAWDTGPVFSADGRTLYYRAMKRPGFEADRLGLMAMELSTGATREIAPRWDRSADNIALSADGKVIYTTAQHMGRHPLWAVDIESGAVTELVGEGSVSAIDVENGVLAFTRNSMATGDQLFTGGINGAPVRALTRSAGELLPDVRFGAYEQFTFKGWDDNTVHAYVVKPWNYEEGKTYPVAFLIHGGPQGSFGDGWSYRWNPQTYAGQGYAVVLIDFHGSTGYGQAFTDAVSGHWGDRPLEDLKKGWAAAQAKYPFLDGDRACALGASYGGYMTNWIAGNWFERDGSAPFKCLVTHNGVFDTRSMGLVTEELWFTEWEFGGTVWDVPENYERFNPARHVGKWKTPMLVVAGANDFRVPVDQSLSTFTALQRRGIESQLLYFPDENHWVLKPQNSVQWHDTVKTWLKKHIGQ